MQSFSGQTGLEFSEHPRLEVIQHHEDEQEALRFDTASHGHYVEQLPGESWQIFHHERASAVFRCLGPHQELPRREDCQKGKYPQRRQERAATDDRRGLVA